MQDSAFGALAADREVGNQREVGSPYHCAIHRHAFSKGTLDERDRLVSVAP